ncbi:MAG TPA: cell wall hydrolase [Xanthobacteraceae bacterium]|nr:cell wall hydrolase [Xanthobacteraceae bacterium]
MPTSFGLQDIASRIARNPLVPDGVRQHFGRAPYGSIHAAAFGMVRPIGTDIPGGYTLASLDPRDVTGTLPPDVSRMLGAIGIEPKRVFPTVNRSAKGDRLVPARALKQDRLPAAQPGPKGVANTLEKEPAPSPAPVENIVAPAAHSAVQTPEGEPEVSAKPAGVEIAALPTVIESQPSADTEAEDEKPESGTPEFANDNPVAAIARVYFGPAPLGGEVRTIEPWAPGATPIVEPPYIHDPDLKRFGQSDPSSADEGETVAGKGEVTGEGRHPKSPAERLGLLGASRVKAEKCLTEAIYFESRGEAVNGQIAVAQVVLNRTFSGVYPSTVCGVVYQNAHRKLACQFTFACDGIPDRVTEPEAWERAKQIARDTLDGKLWLKQVGKSTHYHAYWVRPGWVREMMKLDKLGVHTFYRPRAWGDGEDAPVWGDPVATEEAAKKL